MSALRDLTGRRFGRLLVLERAGSDAWKQARWLSRCDCSVKKIVNAYDLVSGQTKSCGCLKREVAKQRATKHGYATGRKLSPEYHCWASIKARCLNPKNRAFKYYGARGITVCERWRESFTAFLADMGPRPPGTSIHRIDNDGNYEPGNCIWATRAEHETNKRRPRAKRITVEGVRYIGVAAAALAYGVNSRSVRSRMRIHGCAATQAIFALLKQKPRR